MNAEGIFLKQDKGGGRQEGGRDLPRSLHLRHEMGKSLTVSSAGKGHEEGPGPKRPQWGARGVQGPWGLRMCQSHHSQV